METELAQSLRDSGSRYTLAQIALHWGIAALVLWQLVFGESLPSSERIVRNGVRSTRPRQSLPKAMSGSGLRF